MKLANNKYKESECKTKQIFSKFFKNVFKTVCLDVNIAKANTISKKRYKIM